MPEAMENLGVGLLIDRLRSLSKRVTKLQAQYADLKGDVNDLIEEHVTDSETGHYMCHDDAASLMDAGEVEEEEESESPSESESESESD